MLQRSSLGSVALAATLWMTSVAAQAFDESKYPDFAGQWRRPPGVGIQWDPTKRLGRTQQPPLTPEYQVVFEASLKDQAAGGQGNDPTYKCIPAGMPRIMTTVFPMEFIITPRTTYILSDYATPRRIYTDGRDWPNDLESQPTFLGYSIGRWMDEDRDGRYDLLEVETRAFKGPRTYDTTGLPLASDNQSVIKERIYLDKKDHDTLYDEITTIDHALTRPWTIVKVLHRTADARPVWLEENCAENNTHVHIGAENYFIGADGLIMPAKKGQAPPDLKYFKPK